MSTNNLPAPLMGDFAEGFTAIDARAAFDGIAEKMARIVEIIAANRQGIAGATLAEVDLLVRMAGLEADGTADGVGANLNDVWGMRFVACEVEAQALTAIAINKARGCTNDA